MKILIVVSSLGLGGTERVVATIANEWSKAGHVVALATFEDPGAAACYSLSPEVRRIFLGAGASGLALPAKLLRVPRLVFRLRRAIIDFQPERVLSFIDQTNLIALAAVRGLGVPCVVSEQLYPAFTSLAKFAPFRPLSLFLIPLRNALYRRALKVVVLTERSTQCFPADVQRKTVVVPNPVPRLETRADIAPSLLLERPTVVGVGRFARQKRFDRLIEAFHAVSKEFPDWRLALFGQGPEEVSLKAQVARLGLDSRVVFKGTTSEIGSVYRQADIVALSSDYEGFPNVIGEAMALGCAVVSTDCLCGPAEFIQHGVDGILVGLSSAELAGGLRELMAQPERRAQLGRAATKIAERLTNERILDLWNRALELSPPH